MSTEQLAQALRKKIDDYHAATVARLNTFGNRGHYEAMEKENAEAAALDGLLKSLAAHEAEKAQVALTYEEEYLAGALLVNKETRKRIMFYSANMLPNPATLEDRFELVKVYTRPAPAAPASASEAPVAVPMWREIATAPKDGTSVLLCWAIDDDGGPIDWRKDLKTAQVFVKVASWWAGENDWVTYCNHAHEPLVYFEPTHWMPLPAPPHAAPAAPVAVPMTGDQVQMPRTADQAALMALLGAAWLQEHAPERLQPTIRKAAMPEGSAPVAVPLTREQVDDLMTEHYPLESLLRENVDSFEQCVRDIERTLADRWGVKLEGGQG